MRRWTRWMVSALAFTLLAGCAEKTEGAAVFPRDGERSEPATSAPTRSAKPTGPTGTPRTSATPGSNQAPCDQLPVGELSAIYGEPLTMAKASTSCRLNAASGGWIWINAYTSSFAEEAAKTEGRKLIVAGLPALLARFFGEILVSRSPDPNTPGMIIITVKYQPRKDDATLERVRLAAAEKIAPAFRAG